MYLINMSLSALLTILAVIVMRTLFIHKLPKKTFIALWVLVICRLMLPFSVPSRLSVWNVIDALSPAKEVPAAAALPEPASYPVPAGIAQLSVTESAVSSTTGPSPLFWVWLGGFCICALCFLYTHLRFRRTFKTALPVKNQFTKQWLSAHPLRRTVSVLQLDTISTPLTYGILKPVILLPTATNWRDKAGLSYVLTHEYAHIKHFDTLLKWVLAAVLSIHWFNPFVWVMYILANRDMELSCDETVLRIYGENTKSVYALTLLNLAEKKHTRLLSLCSNFSSFIEERIVSIMKTRKVSFAAVVAAFVLVSGITMVFTTSKAVPKAVPPTLAAEDELDPQSSATALLLGTDPPALSQYRERMLFVTEADIRISQAAVKVTYDGETWEYYSAKTEKEDWKWYSYDEYAEYIESIRVWNENPGRAAWVTVGVEKDLEKHMQTLADIGNGIKVSNRKPIFIENDTAPHIASINDVNQGWEGCVQWYCFGYSFTDKAGNEVDLGLFDTRDELFAALKDYYDAEVAAGTLTLEEADLLYGQIAHESRNVDEVPLEEKLLNYKLYNLFGLYS